MKRGDFYRVYRGSKYDPKDYRVYLVVSRQEMEAVNAALRIALAVG